MGAPLRYHDEYPTYQRLFRALRPFFWLLYRMERVPKTFYVKFCGTPPSLADAPRTSAYRRSA